MKTEEINLDENLDEVICPKCLNEYDGCNCSNCGYDAKEENNC